MTKDPPQPLRGDAAWRAEKDRVAQRNEDAYKRGREQRAAQYELAKTRERAAQRREDAEMPHQPT